MRQANHRHQTSSFDHWEVMRRSVVEFAAPTRHGLPVNRQMSDQSLRPAAYCATVEQLAHPVRYECAVHTVDNRIEWEKTTRGSAEVTRIPDIQ